MINRFTLVAITAAFALTGCAKITAATSATGSAVKSAADSVLIPKLNTPDFSSGPTVVTVKHVATLADDGEPLYVTIDGTDAGILAMGQTVSLHVAAGKHKVGGYARSLIGRVTLSPVEVTTSTHADQHVQYAVTNTSPAFTVRPSTKVYVAPVIAPAPAPVVTAPAVTVPAVTTPVTGTTSPAATSTPTTSTSATTTTPTTTTTTTTPSTATTSSSAATTTSSSTTTATPSTGSSTTSSKTTTPASTSTSAVTTTPTTTTPTTTTPTSGTSTTTTTPSTDTVPTAPSL